MTMDSGGRKETGDRKKRVVEFGGRLFMVVKVAFRWGCKQCDLKGECLQNNETLWQLCGRNFVWVGECLKRVEE